VCLFTEVHLPDSDELMSSDMLFDHERTLEGDR
jgi:hypothetical protein